jgi:hypothetical protein
MSKLKTDKDLAIAAQMLREIRHQDFLIEAAWDLKELRRWMKKVDRFLQAMEVA